MIRVLVVDDHDLVRTGITRMLADIDGLQVIGQAESGEEALKATRERIERVGGQVLGAVFNRVPRKSSWLFGRRGA